MVFPDAWVRSLVNIRERISREWSPEILMIPIAPPVAVAMAQMVSLFIYNYLDAIEHFLDERVDTVFILCIHLLGIAVGDDHTAGHGVMT